jgi:hypothetical protein
MARDRAAMPNIPNKQRWRRRRRRDQVVTLKIRSKLRERAVKIVVASPALLCFAGQMLPELSQLGRCLGSREKRPRFAALAKSTLRRVAAGCRAAICRLFPMVRSIMSDADMETRGLDGRSCYWRAEDEGRTRLPLLEINRFHLICLTGDGHVKTA